MSDETNPKLKLTPIPSSDPSKSTEYVSDVRVPEEVTADNFPRPLLEAVTAAFNHVKDGHGEISQVDLPILARVRVGEPDPDISHIKDPTTEAEMNKMLAEHDVITIYVVTGNARAMFEGAIKALDGLNELMAQRDQMGHLPGCPEYKRNIQ